MQLLESGLLQYDSPESQASHSLFAWPCSWKYIAWSYLNFFHSPIFFHIQCFLVILRESSHFPSWRYILCTHILVDAEIVTYVLFASMAYIYILSCFLTCSGRSSTSGGRSRSCKAMEVHWEVPSPSRVFWLPLSSLGLFSIGFTGVYILW
jgi:hypothetical protein